MFLKILKAYKLLIVLSEDQDSGWRRVFSNYLNLHNFKNAFIEAYTSFAF